MMNALWVSATGMAAQQLNMDTISNNLANVNTTGFKSAHAQFADLYAQAVLGGTGAEGEPAAGEGLGTRTLGITREYSQGEIQTTGNPLDVAISGDGFLPLLKPDGTLTYTRDGSLQISSDGYLCNALGYRVSPEIQIPENASEIAVAADGTVTARTPTDAAPRALGQLELARFVNPAGLRAEGENLLTATTASGEAQVGTPGADGLGTILGGSLERSNVNLMTEMVNLILTQRAYEVNTKAIQSVDEMMRMANNLRRV